MINLWQKYFADVRWMELLMAMALAFGGAILTNMQAGEKIGQEQLLKAGSVALGIGWAYLRVPKSQGQSHTDETNAQLNLPPKLDPTELIVSKLVSLGYPESLARSEIARDLQGIAASVGVQLP